MIRYKYGNKSLSLPTGWHEIQYHTAVNIINSDSDLNICCLLSGKDWNEISEDFLNDKYLEIINKEWNMDKLKISHWLEFIKINEKI